MADIERSAAEALSAEVLRRRQLARDAGRERVLERQRRRGKLTARERLDLVLDDGSFRETGMLVLPPQRARDWLSVEDDDEWARIAAADGMLTGTGSIDGRPVSIGSFDFSVMGGSNGEMGGMKLTRQGQTALAAGHPLVVLFDGGGHRIQEGLEAWTFESGSGILPVEVEMSGYAPMVGALMGPVFGGMANFAVIMDLVLMVEGIGSAGLAGPALVKAATGESITKEDLGGPRLQANVTGVVDLVVPDEEAAAAAIKRFLGYLPSNCHLEPPVALSWTAPHVPDGALEQIIPAEARRYYDVRDILNLVFDEDSLFELRPTFARNAVTALGRLQGRPVGVIANQPRHLAGSLDAHACEKLSRFVSICDAYGLPIISFIDVPGFLIGSAAERSGMARRASRLAFEMGSLQVPLISVVLRKGFGMGYVAMGGGRVLNARLCLAWPTATVAAMSIEGAVDTVFRDNDDSAEARDLREERISAYRATTGAVGAAQTFAVDDVILPSETRDCLIDSLRAGSGRVPRVQRKFRSIPPI
jgi:acetyl-CoA carboxylase carboxyltransferase component